MRARAIGGFILAALAVGCMPGVDLSQLHPEDGGSEESETVGDGVDLGDRGDAADGDADAPDTDGLGRDVDGDYEDAADDGVGDTEVDIETGTDGDGDGDGDEDAAGDETDAADMHPAGWMSGVDDCLDDPSTGTWGLCTTWCRGACAGGGCSYIWRYCCLPGDTAWPCVIAPGCYCFCNQVYSDQCCRAAPGFVPPTGYDCANGPCGSAGCTP